MEVFDYARRAFPEKLRARDDSSPDSELVVGLYVVIFYSLRCPLSREVKGLPSHPAITAVSW